MAQDVIEVEGIVTDVLGGGKYGIHIEDMALDVVAYAAGKMKKFNIRIIPGDVVKVELNPYEPTTGRITYRSINKQIKKKKGRRQSTRSMPTAPPTKKSISKEKGTDNASDSTSVDAKSS